MVGLLAVVASTVAISACGGSNANHSARAILDEASAVTRARELTVLAEPITVVGVEEGGAGALVRVPGGLYRNEDEAARELATRQRQAWGVTLVGRYRADCIEADPCPLVPSQHQLAIDRETGELLLQILGGDLPAASLDGHHRG